MRSEPAHVPDGLLGDRFRAFHRHAGDRCSQDFPGGFAAWRSDPHGVITRLAVRVQPGARREALVGWLEDGTLKLAVAAPPQGGRANRAVEALLAGALGLKARQVTVSRGASARTKTVEI